MSGTGYFYGVFMALFIALAAVQPAHAGLEAPSMTVPAWPPQFTSVYNVMLHWRNNTAPPPYVDPSTNGLPPWPYEVYQGTTFYDWPNRRMIQAFDSRAFAGSGCKYETGACKVLNQNHRPDGKDGPVTYSWMTTGPDAGKCCEDIPVYVLPPDFVKTLARQSDVKLEGDDVEWYAAEGGMPFMGYYKDRRVRYANGTESQYPMPAFHGGAMPFDLPGYRWQRWVTMMLGQPNEEMFEVPSQCIGAPRCPLQPPPVIDTVTSISGKPNALRGASA